MNHGYQQDPALVVAIAFATGMIAQSIADHLRVPGIVVLLGAGALLGPDGLGVIDPGALGPALQILVGFAVAVVLFEGGMNLDLRRLRRESEVIRRLITVGAVVTAAGGTLAAHVFMGWEWRVAVLFGTLVIVTGPTVVTPLVRRIKLNRNLSTVLEAEGVLIDPIGAIAAGVALEIVVRPAVNPITSGPLNLAFILALGAVLGLAGGLVMAFLLRHRWLVPEGLENVLVLSMVLALFHVSNALEPESGIGSVTVAGIVIGNVRTRALRDLMEFKEQITVMLIGMLFVLLAADVRMAELRALGARGLLTVVALMVVVRPLNVLASTAGSKMSVRERAFLVCMAPRGIVAAAVASFFSVELEKAGIPGGQELRAMVFLVIALTVVVQGLSGGPIADLLRVRRGASRGYAILGANDLSRALARALRVGGEEVLFLDSNSDASHSAEQEGFRVVFGNALEERTLLRARMDSYANCVGLTRNEEVNLLFVTRVHEEHRVPGRHVALHLVEGHVTGEMVQNAGARILFGAARDIDLWTVRLRRGLAVEERWRCGAEDLERAAEIINPGPRAEENLPLPVAVYRRGTVFPLGSGTRLIKDDEVLFLLFKERLDEARTWLRERGFDPGAPTGENGARDHALEGR